MVLAQSTSSAGVNWSAGWGFRSASDSSLALQQAQVIKNAEQGPQVTSQTIYNTTYATDNRTNYVETTNSSTGTVTATSIGNDQIGTNTNAVGSMNTGTTNISISGNGDNTVTATNSSDSTGCTNGSVASNSGAPLSAFYPDTVAAGAGTATASSNATGGTTSSGYPAALDNSGSQSNVCN
ncbi:hypothetical protein [Limimaricola sp.]|uniref:hypothetical protein n=1 Tax=Limimaricola sp. TaxID=2211665 RepID=UPI0025B8B2D7|nr:hypothetical protein [Limimaricola sp.]